MEFITDFNVPKGSIFDTHAHYDSENFDGIRDEILNYIKDNGIYKVINCGCDAASIESSTALSEKYPFIYSALGYHPEEIDKGFDICFLKEKLKHEKCVAIGEIGLDYHYRDDNKDKQKNAFIKQIELSLSLNMPVIVHNRDAHADTLEILKYYKPKGVLHCFSGSPETAEEILKLGMYIGVGGSVTFKNAKKLPDVVKMLPDNKILFETDCPYMAPVPFRGKLCHSVMISSVAQKVAELRGTTSGEMLKITKQNADTLFFGG